jgi:hypothetical protein
MSAGAFSLGASETVVPDNRQVATDSGRVTRGNRNVQTESGGLTIGERGQVNAPGSVNLTGAKIGTGKGNVTINATNVPPDFFSGVGDLLTQSVNALGQQSQQAIGALQQSQQQGLGAVTDLTANTQDAGTVSQNKFGLHVVLGVLAAIVAAIWLFKRH